MEMLEEITSAKFVEYDWVQFTKNIRKIHSQGFVHRDIRCQNIMARGNTLVLIDWGYSCKANTQHLCNGTAITASQRILKLLLRSEIVSWDVWDDIEGLVKVFLIYFLNQELKVYELGNSMDRIKEYASYWEYWEQNERNAKAGFALCKARDFDGLLDWMARLLQIKRNIAAGTYHK
jgi:serine/threonine protein kinase